MKRARIWLLFSLGLMPTTALADGVIQIPVSVKIIADPGTGEGPPGVTSFGIVFAIDNANARLTEYSRGYRLVLVDPVTLVGVLGETARPYPGHYYASSITSLPRLEMESDATANPQLWAWNFGAINIYINHAPGQGFRGLLCSHPESQILVIDDFHAGSERAYIHMLGHYFGLCHTHGCGCNCPPDDCEDSESDGISDTLPDGPNWDIDDLAFLNFGADYADLTPAQQALVDATLNNMMSYRIGGLSCNLISAFTDYLTEGQLDRWADVASTTRLSACDGCTFFVQAGAGGLQNGRSIGPFDRVAEGVAAATGGGDIVLIRGGTYTETPTISSPVTLRAPRDQVVRIGG